MSNLLIAKNVAHGSLCFSNSFVPKEFCDIVINLGQSYGTKMIDTWFFKRLKFLPVFSGNDWPSLVLTLYKQDQNIKHFIVSYNWTHNIDEILCFESFVNNNVNEDTSDKRCFILGIPMRQSCCWQLYPLLVQWTIPPCLCCKMFHVPRLHIHILFQIVVPRLFNYRVLAAVTRTNADAWNTLLHFGWIYKLYFPTKLTGFCKWYFLFFWEVYVCIQTVWLDKNKHFSSKRKQIFLKWLLKEETDFIEPQLLWNHTKSEIFVIWRIGIVYCIS